MATDNIFPPQLPKPSASYSFSKDDGCASTTFASGKVRRRNLHNDLRRLVSLQWEFDQRELDWFQGWYGYVLDNGASNFKIDLLLDADGYNNYEVTPVSGIKVTHFGVNYWRVTLQVLCIEQKYVTGDVIELFNHYGDSFESMLAADDMLDLFINTELPSYFGE